MKAVERIWQAVEDWDDSGSVTAEQALGELFNGDCEIDEDGDIWVHGHWCSEDDLNRAADWLALVGQVLDPHRKG
jgi:hypothetical protein